MFVVSARERNLWNVHDSKSGFMFFGGSTRVMIYVLRLVPKDETLDLSAIDRDGWICWPASELIQDMRCRDRF